MATEQFEHCVRLLARHSLQDAVSFALASRGALSITDEQRAAVVARVLGQPASKPLKKLPKVAKKGTTRTNTLKRGGKRGGATARPAAAAADVDHFVAKHVRVYWPEQAAWFEGIVTKYDPATRQHCTLYGLGTDNVEVAWEALHELSPALITVLGPASAEAFAPAVLFEEEEPAPDQGGAAAALMLSELTMEQLEAEVDRTNSVDAVTNIQAEYAARQADLKARLEDTDSDSELE